jgi:chitinase
MLQKILIGLCVILCLTSVYFYLQMQQWKKQIMQWEQAIEERDQQLEALQTKLLATQQEQEQQYNDLRTKLATLQEETESCQKELESYQTPARDSDELSDIQTVISSTDNSIIPFEFRVLDAEYSRSLDRLVLISENPNRLHLYDPVGQTDDAIDLPRSPQCAAVSADGKFAAIGHDALISYVNLENKQVIKTLNVTTDVVDIVVAGNGWIYASPRRDQWEKLRAVNIDTNNEVQGKPSIYAGAMIQLHPGGSWIYYTERGLSPSDVAKIDISEAPFSSTPQAHYDSPYHGDYEICGNLWMSEDGQRIFTACGNIFRASSSREQDMTYNGNLSRLPQIQHVVHSQAAGKVLAIPIQADSRFSREENLPANQVVIFGYNQLNTENIVTMPDFIVDEKHYAANGRFVFVNSSGDQYYVIVQADEASGLLNDYGLVVESF